jgi:hypothetical protein
MRKFKIILTDDSEIEQEYTVSAENEAAAYAKAYEYRKHNYGTKIKSVKEVK